MADLTTYHVYLADWKTYKGEMRATSLEAAYQLAKARWRCVVVSELKFDFKNTITYLDQPQEKAA